MNQAFCSYCMAPVRPGESCPACGLTSGAYVPSPHHLPPGTILLGRYLVGRVLGEGGFGITYIGRDLRLDRKVAIKEYYPIDRATRNAAASMTVTSFIGPASQSYERGKQKFLEEARTMARLEKQHVIVSVRDFFEDNNTGYIVMEYVEGITFRDLTEQRGGRIQPEELFRILEPLFDALAIMHESDLIHRDISPDNLMLEGGRVRLLDFGCAREASRGTETLTIALKHGYAPLEQYQQKGQGPWTDVYALCATIYFCLTGKAPPQALDRIVEDELLVPTKLGIPLTDAQEAALVKGLRCQPRRRFQTVRELWAALYAAEPVSAPVTEDDIPLVPPAEIPQTAPQAPQVTAAAIETAEVAEAGSPAPVQTAESFPDRPDETPKAGKDGRVMNILLTLSIPAIILVFILIVWLSGSGANPPAASTPPVLSAETAAPENPGKSGESEAPEASEIPYDASVFEHAFHLTLPNEDALRAAMENDDFSSIVISPEASMELRGGLTVTKPLLIPQDTILASVSPVVIDGGLLRVEGRMEGEFTIRTLHGGRISVAEGRELRLYTGSIWLENANDLSVEPGGSCYVNGESYDSASPRSILVFNEDWARENGVRVSNNAELVTALYNANSDTPAIVIEGNIQYSVDKHPNVPIIVAEGASLEGPSDLSRAWYLEDSLLINHGSVWCSFAAYDGERAPWAVINDGDMRVATTVHTDGIFINNGYLELLGGELSNGIYFNHGELCINRAADDFDTCLDVYTYAFLNNGVMRLNRDNNRILFSGSTRLANFGEIRIDGGWVEMNSYTHNRGSILIHEGGVLSNHGILENHWILKEDVPGGYEYGADGVILCFNENDLRLSDPWENYAARIIPCRWEDSVHVSTAQEMLDALQSDASVVIAHGYIDMGGIGINPRVADGRTLVIPVQLILGSHSMYISNGSTLLAGEVNAFSNHLFLEQGSTAVIGSLVDSSVSLRSDSRLYVMDPAYFDKGFDVGQDCLVSFSNGVHLQGVSSSGIHTLYCWGGEILAENVHMTVDRLEAYCSTGIDPNSTLEVLEHANMAHSGFFTNQIDGRLINHGHLDLPSNTMLNGTLINHGDVFLYNWDCDLEVHGRLENPGTIHTDARIRGEFIGNDPQPFDE